MSRIGKNPLTVPQGVVVIPDDDGLRVELGEKSLRVPWFGRFLKLRQEDGQLWVDAKHAKQKRTRELWGTQWRLISCAIEGVTRGFEKRLEIQGVGMRVQVKGSALTLQLGYSHDIHYTIPDDVSLSLSGDRNNVITITGCSKQRVGQVASELRAYRPPEVYKGKGIRYQNEQVLLKDGKKK